MIKVYDLNMQPAAYLENAFAIGYETAFNSLWTASFSLPADDPKNAECLPLRFVEIFDGDERVDLFRIIPTETQRGDGPTITYQLEHVLATLLDDVLFQYHQVGNLGVYTTAVLQYILNQQETPRWRLGTVDFAHQFEHKWENDNLLGALFSVPTPFIEAYQWTWDTSTYPWTLNLVAAETEPSCRVRYGYNLKGITKTEDPTDLCTRMYCLGYGEGVNQLTIKDVNGGLPYLEASTSVVKGGQYPIVSRIFTDRRYESAETLKAAGQALLEQLKLPRLTYQVDAVELYRLTEDTVDKFVPGAMVRVIDEELGIYITSRVVNVQKSDIEGAPGDVQIEIANRPLDIAGSIAELADRQRISEVYSQGATNLDSHDFADNADAANPAVIRFYIPAETVRINKMTLSYEVGQFRAYSKALSLAAATVGTTESGGGGLNTTSTQAQQTPTTSTQAQQTPTTTTQAQQTPTTTTQQATVQSSTTSNEWNQFAILVPDATGVNGTHNHGLTNGDVLVKADGTHVTFVESGAHSHSLTSDHKHTVTIPEHAHQVTIPEHAHQVTIPAHEHQVTIPSHNHQIDIQPHAHGVTIPEHTHEIQYGIFLRSPAPSAVTVQVDGVAVPGLGVRGSDVDIIPYLAKDSGGKVTRGAWHEIKITPNDLGRVVANVVTQLFVQSRGGGSY